MTSNPLLLETEIVSTLKEYSALATGMLGKMFWTGGEHRGLYSFKILPGPGGTWKNVGTSHRYSLIAWIGQFSARPEETPALPAWRLACERWEHEISRDPGQFTLGEMGLLLWLAAISGAGWRDAVLRALPERWRRGEREADTLETGWLAAGLAVSSGDEGLLRRATARILESYNPETRLFCFEPYRPSRYFRASQYRRVLGSFASQVYSITALSQLLRRQSEAGIAAVVEAAAERMAGLQGPNGEWWWIYDVRDGSVAMDYPVYSVHQDGMGPMALLAAMEALGHRKWSGAVQRSLRVITEYRTASGDGFVEEGVIWRAAVRDLPGEDPADLPFGLSPVERRVLLERGRPALFRRARLPENVPFRMLKEARSYCPGWILYAYALACSLYGPPAGAGQSG
jgi:hypothetical protein